MFKKIIIVVLGVIWIILSGTYIDYHYKIGTFGCSNSNKPYQMTATEIEGFNSTFTSYEGEQIGSSVKALISRLIANSNTYADELEKIPMVSYNSNSVTEDKNVNISNTYCQVVEEDNNDKYNDYLGIISRGLDFKHTYGVTFTFNEEGLLKGITINYNYDNMTDNFELVTINDSSEVRVIDGVYEINDSNIEESKQN